LREVLNMSRREIANLIRMITGTLWSIDVMIGDSFSYSVDKLRKQFLSA
jgi:hypothetical protein